MTPLNNSEYKESLLGHYEQLVIEEDQLISKKASYQELITMILDFNLQSEKPLNLSVMEDLLSHINDKFYETNRQLLSVCLEKGYLTKHIAKTP